MTVCLDTNVVLQARALSHRYGVLLDSFQFGRISLAVSSRILMEYEEILTAKAGERNWRKLSLFIHTVARRRQNLLVIDPCFEFRVISQDPDDNMFTDCAIAAHADYVITEDRHFAPLANAGYKPQPITPDEFIAKYRGVYV